jgi:hypothetical protein
MATYTTNQPADPTPCALMPWRGDTLPDLMPWRGIASIAVVLLLAACAGQDAKVVAGPDGASTESGGYAGGDRAVESDFASCLGEDCIETVPPGQLTAGEWDDLANWWFWAELMAPIELDAESWAWVEDYWGLFTRDRASVHVRVGDGPVVDAEVRLIADDQTIRWTARTDASGRAEVFGGLFGEASSSWSLEVECEPGRITRVDTVSLDANVPIEIAVDIASDASDVLDLAFVVDTTGSMGDELHYLQAELRSVVGAVRSTHTDVTVRVGIVVYRDEGDEYVTRSSDLTEDIDVAQRFLDGQYASGGGDIPEAVDVALHTAVHDLTWSPSARARLLVLALDAPPHHRPDALARMREAIETASATGVRIIGLSGSGIDKPTEFLLRSLGIATGGTYTFLTDHSGLGDAHLEQKPTIGGFQVELLNELLTRLVFEALEGTER